MRAAEDESESLELGEAAVHCVDDIGLGFAFEQPGKIGADRVSGARCAFQEHLQKFHGQCIYGMRVTARDVVYHRTIVAEILDAKSANLIR